MKWSTLYILAVFLCLMPPLVSAQSAWQWQNPTPQGNSLRDVAVWLPATAIAVGVNGSVVKSTDGGATWSVCPTVPGMPVLSAVSFVDANTVVVVSSAGILRSTNGGQTWTTQSSVTGLYDVDFADALHGIAVGSSGTILRSNDGGLTWAPQTSGASVTLTAASVVDASTAIAVGDFGTILRTDNGGVSWVPQTSGITKALWDVDFIDANTGTAVGYQIALTTADGGVTWTNPVSYSDPAEVMLRAVDQVDGLNAFVAGEDNYIAPVGVVLRTNNGWASWGTFSGSSTLFGVAMFSSSEGVAVGAAGIIRRTTDGGATWPQVAGGQERFSMRAVEFYDAQHGIAASIDNWYDLQTSRIYLTVDGGGTWNVLQPFTWSQVLDVTYADGSTIYAVGHGPFAMDGGARIWQSTNGGATWGTLWGSDCYPGAPSCYPELRAVDFAGPDAGVAVGSGIFMILGGVVEAGPYYALNGVSVPSRQVAYAVGDGGLILKGDLVSRDWVPLTSGTSAYLYDVFFTDDMTGTVVGSMGTILRTTDGGATWVPQTTGTAGSFTGVSFIDELNGIVAGGGSTIFKTINGGDNWLPEETQSSSGYFQGSMNFGVHDVAFIDIANIVAVGGNENIIARLDQPVPVFFQQLTASVKDRAVELRWAVYSDEVIKGYRVYRNDVSVTAHLIAPAEHAFVDATVVPETEYQYVIAAVGESGNETRSWPVAVRMPSAPVALYQNHPNPFNPGTSIGFSLPAEMHVTLNVYDIAGRRVATLADGVYAGGEHALTWDGTNVSGEPAASGVYFYELRTANGALVRKMMLLK